MCDRNDEGKKGDRWWQRIKVLATVTDAAERLFEILDRR